MEKILTEDTPFDNIDLLLVTHRHIDHFHPELVFQYLTNNSRCKMIGTQQTVDQLKESPTYNQIKNQILPITPEFEHTKNIDVNGIELTVLRLKHCTYMVTDPNTGNKVNRHRDMQNLGFIINIGNQKILHIGDCGMESENEYKNYKIDQEEIDIAFLGSLFWQPYEPRIKIVNNYIKPQNIILMHLDKGNKEKCFVLKDKYKDRLAPITIFEKELEERVFRK